MPVRFLVLGYNRAMMIDAEYEAQACSRAAASLHLNGDAWQKFVAYRLEYLHNGWSAHVNQWET